MSDPKPTLISEILAACALVDNDRSRDDIMLHAVTELGELATEIQIASGKAPGKTVGADGVAGEAMDLILCLVDYLRAHDPDICDAALVAARTTHKANHDKPFTFIALAWGVRENTTLMHRQSRLLDVMSLVADLHDGPEDQHYRERLWRREIGANVLCTCLALIAGERPGITDDELIDMARPKLDKWVRSCQTAAPGPEV
ncbi:hypothetical protein [Paracoccus sp. ME4]|uniref:hypothetical protein n=1 Tax=Paracoccus sp. ME4 TaxID=3138066 RepID=UPI00398B014C